MTFREGWEGKTAFITGGSSGIGLATARELSRAGAHVAVFGRNQTRLEAAVKLIAQVKRHPEQRSAGFPCDVSEHTQVKEAFEQAIRQFHHCDLLVNCAGRARPGYFEEITGEQFEETMRINMFGIWNTCAFLVPLMKERGGYIVNTSSVAGLMGIFGYSDYSASKFAVIGFSEALRSELRRHNIHVSVLCPPDTDTPGLTEENKTKPLETKVISRSVRLMTPEGVARALLKGIEKKRFIILPNFSSRLAWLVKRHAPWLFEQILARQIAKAT